MSESNLDPEMLELGLRDLDSDEAEPDDSEASVLDDAAATLADLESPDRALLRAAGAAAVVAARRLGRIELTLATLGRIVDERLPADL